MLLPILENTIVRLEPLKESDFETLYSIASDPLVWEQHPNKNRFKRDVFQTFFEGAILSKGAYIAYDTGSGEAIGTSRFYDHNAETKTISIGYTFIARRYWGKGQNRAMKTLMLDYAFTLVEQVHFHIGAVNIRSQKAIEKLGALKTGEEVIAYHGEQENLNYIYSMSRDRWTQLKLGNAV